MSEPERASRLRVAWNLALAVLLLAVVTAAGLLALSLIG